MGSEVSTESGKNNGPRNPIMRTNSLKDVNVDNENTNKLNSGGQKIGKPVKRSNTFSGLSGVRPQVTRRSKKKPSTAFQNKDAYISEDVCFDVTDDKGIDLTEEETQKDNNDDILFIPTKKNYGSMEVSHSPTEKKSHTSKDFTDDGQADSGVERSSLFEPKDFEEETVVQETNLTTCNSSGSDKEKQRRLNHSNDSLDDEEQYRYKKRSKDESKVDSINADKDAVDGNNSKTRGSNVTRIKSSEKRKKVTRSKSLNCPNKYVSVVEETYNSELEDDGTASRMSDSKRDNFEPIGRRTSDSYLLREQHVKKSEQFTAMLKQIRETREQTPQELSPYALGAIAGRNSPSSPPPRTRQLKQNYYFDSWIKDQSARIDSLAQALRGDEFKVNEFRSSFRERGLQSCNWEVLPIRPKSDKLPRRRIHVSRIKKYMSSDTEDESFLQESYGKPTSRSHDGEILTKQLSETFFLLDNSFKISKKDFPRHERSSGSSISSLSHRRISNSTFSDYGTLEEKPDSCNEADSSINLDNSAISGIS